MSWIPLCSSTPHTARQSSTRVSSTLTPGRTQSTPRTLIGSPPTPPRALPCTVAMGLVPLCAAPPKTARPIGLLAIGCLQIWMHSKHACVPVLVILGIVSDVMSTLYGRPTMSYVLYEDIRQPLNPILGFISRLIKSAFTLSVEDVRLRLQHQSPLRGTLLESRKAVLRITGDKLWCLGAKMCLLMHQRLFRSLRDARPIRLRPISSPPHNTPPPVVP